jgi:hypothetical protein
MKANMKKGRRETSLFLIMFVMSLNQYAQDKVIDTAGSKIINNKQLEILLEKPPCLEGYRTNQSGPLSRIDLPFDTPPDSTFTIERIRIPSDGFLINGWLYLPLGSEKHPLVVLTNGGGDGSRPIKSLSEWLAPILAHCGIAVIPNCGHAPVNIETKRMIRLDNIILNWLNEDVIISNSQFNRCIN